MQFKEELYIFLWVILNVMYVTMANTL